KPELERAYPRVSEVPFDSARKRMTTVHESPDGGFEVCTKGGVDEVLAVCSGLDDEQLARIDAANRDMAARALRVLAIAGRRVGADGARFTGVDGASSGAETTSAGAGTTSAGAGAAP